MATHSSILASRIPWTEEPGGLPSKGDPMDCVYGRKIMTNLDSILKSRDITLPTKVRLVKSMVFPVVIYGCESWKNLSVEELMLLNCGVREDS